MLNRRLRPAWRILNGQVTLEVMGNGTLNEWVMVRLLESRGGGLLIVDLCNIEDYTSEYGYQSIWGQCARTSGAEITNMTVVAMQEGVMRHSWTVRKGEFKHTSKAIECMLVREIVIYVH